MRIAVALLLTVHGLVHLLGFVKPWRLAEVPALTGRSLVPLSEAASRAVGLVWLVAGVLLVVAAGLLVAKSEAWWASALAGVVVSQALVVLQWPDAKAGTVANVLVVVVLVVTGATRHVRGVARSEARALFAAAGPSPGAIVGAEELAPLPAPVRRWLDRAGVVGRPRARTLRLRQTGTMHTGKDAPWMPVDAEQYVTIDEPGFVWSMRARMLAVVPLVGRDAYVGGRGDMRITAFGLVKVADDRGPKIDQGAMLRFLAEIIWYPSAALAPYVAWEPVDDAHAKATITNGGITASALFTFDDQGRAVDMLADRYYGASGGLEKWGGRSTEWRVVRGVEIPVRGEVVWHLKEGDFTFFRWEIVDAEPNVPVVYDVESPRTGGIATSMTAPGALARGSSVR